MKLFQLFLALLIFANANNQCLPAQEDQVVQWLDTKQLLVVEAANLSQLVDDGSKLTIFRSENREELSRFLAHEKFGLFNPTEFPERMTEIADFFHEVRPQQMVFAINGDTLVDQQKLQWQLLFQTREKTDAEQSQQWADALNKFVKSIQREPDRAASEAKNPEGEKPSPPDSLTELKVHLHPSSGTKIYEITDSVFFFGYQNGSGFASDLDNVHRLLDRMSGKDTQYKKLLDSRNFTGVRNQIRQTSKKATSLDIHFNPILIPHFVDYFDVKQARLLGLHEIAAIGMGINILPAGSNEFSTMVANLYAKTTLPRTGVCNLIQMTKVPTESPPMPEELIFYYSMNFDYQRYYFGKRELLQTMRREGEQVVDEAPTEPTPADEYEVSIMRQFDSHFGGCWHRVDGQIQISTFAMVFDPEEFTSLMTDGFEKVYPDSPADYGYERSEIDGTFALLTKPNQYLKGRYGSVFMDRWMISGSEHFLRQSLQAGLDKKVPPIVDQWVKQLGENVDIDSELPIVVATTPGYWDVMIVTYFMRWYGYAIGNEFARTLTGSEAENEQARNEVISKLNRMEFGEPNSREQCEWFLKLTIIRQVIEFVGTSVAVGWDHEGAGFRIAAMTFPAAEEK